MSIDFNKLDNKEKHKKQREYDEKYFSTIHKLANQGPHILQRPETNLEFWLGQEVYPDDLKEMQRTFDCTYGGGRTYLGKHYNMVDNDGYYDIPEEYVTYYVEEGKISSIQIKDPNVYVYGLNMLSSKEEIKNVMIKNGFTPAEKVNLFSGISYVDWILGSIHINFDNGIAIWTYHIGDEDILY